MVWVARAVLTVVAWLGWMSQSFACDCIPYRHQVLPPEQLAFGSRFLAPINTKVWVIETVELPSAASHFFVSKHGDRKLNDPVGQAWSESSYRRSDTDCKVNSEYRVTMISPKLLGPNLQYDVIRDFEQKAEVIGSFWTGSKRDITPPVIDGPLSCLGEDGEKPAEASCDLFLPAMNIQVTARDENTPVKLLLYLKQPVGYGAFSTKTPPVMAVEPNHVRLITGNVCEGRTIRLPDPFEPGRLDITAMDLAGNQSQVRTCGILGPQTYALGKALERVRGCPAPPITRSFEPRPWPNLVTKDSNGDSARWWIIGLGTICVLLSIACLVLTWRVRQIRK